jgi:hypothetical protein
MRGSRMVEYDPNRNWLRVIWHLAGTPAFSPLTLMPSTRINTFKSL